jgi:hypothetical protein
MPGQALKGYKKLHLPQFMGNRHMNMARLSNLRTGHLYPQGDGTHFCHRLSRPQGHSAVGVIKSMPSESNLPLKFLSII